MELDSQSHAQSYEVPAENYSLSGHLSAVCDAIFAPNPHLSKSTLTASLDALDTQYNRFRLALEVTRFKRVLFLKDKLVFRNVRVKLYGPEDIETVFYDVAGDKGILALIMFRRTEGTTAKWKFIARPLQEWLVKRASAMLSNEVLEWFSAIPKEGLLDCPQSPDSQFINTFSPSANLLPPKQEASTLPIQNPRIHQLHKKILAPKSNPSFRQELQQTLPRRSSQPPKHNNLSSSDLTDFAVLLGCLGEAQIPTNMLVRAAKPKPFFRAGEVVEIPAPLIPCIQNIDSALIRLEFLELIQFERDVNGEPMSSIKVLPKLRSLIQQTSSDTRKEMEYKATMLVFHSFPVDPDTNCDGLFSEMGKSQLPHFQRVLTYFDRADIFNQFSWSQLEEIILSCLSASGFSHLEWKLRVLDTVERILKTCPVSQSTLLLQAKLRFRQTVLARLYPTTLKGHFAYEEVPPTDASLNAFLGEKELWLIQDLIYDNRLSSAWNKLREMSISDRPSTEERRVSQKRLILQVRICRFQGDFPGARHLLSSFDKLDMFNSLVPCYLSEFVAISCELGELHVARKAILEREYLAQPWLELQAKGRRMSLAAAGVHLMEGLWELKNGSKRFDVIQPSLAKAKAIYASLVEVYQTVLGPGVGCSIRYFSASAGLAMASHLECRIAGTIKWEEVLRGWQATLVVAEVVGKTVGQASFPQMIISYSLCDTTSHLRMSQTTELYNKAKALYEVTGRQFQYLALGSLWLDLVGEWNEEHGLPMIFKPSC